MAVSTTNGFDGPYTANGATTTFPFTFTAPTTSEVSVLLRDADGVESVASSLLYTVTLGATSGGSVVFDTAPAAGHSLVVYLDPFFTQEIAFEDGSAWRASPVNEQADRSAARDQALKRESDRALKVPLDESGLQIPVVANRAEKALFFDAAGDITPISVDDFSAPAAEQAGLAEGFATILGNYSLGIRYSAAADGVDPVVGVSDGRSYEVLTGGRITGYVNNGGVATGPLYEIATAAQSAPTVWTVGRETAVAGSKMAIRWLRDDATYPLEDEASIWAGKVATDHGISATFTSADGQAGSPSNGLFVMANNDGSPGDVVAGMFDAVARADGAAVFGANIIARGTGKAGCKFVGLEIDVEPSASDSSINSSSAGLYINIFNKAISGPAIQTGSVGGGTFANGFILGGLASTAAGLAIEASSSADSLVNTTAGTFSTVALLLGNGQSRGIRLSGTASAHAFIYNDSSNNVRNVLGSGLWIWRNNANTASLASIADSAGQAVFNLETSAGEYRVNGTKVVGARGSAITAPTGGATVDAESRTAIGVIISRLQAHGLIA